MHALEPFDPLRHRLALLLALTVAVLLALAAAAPDLGSLDLGGADATGAAPVAAPTGLEAPALTAEPQEQPRWLREPLASPLIGLAGR